MSTWVTMFLQASPEAGDPIAEAAAPAANVTSEKPPSTPEGMAVAYGGLVIMALLPIFFGSFRSVLRLKEQKVSLFFFQPYSATHPIFYSNRKPARNPKR
jgi:uncharacterized membrane protein